MNQISAKLAELLLGSGDHTGNLGSSLVGQRGHDVILRHIHPRSQNDRKVIISCTADMMSAMRLVFGVRHDTAFKTLAYTMINLRHFC